MSLAFNVDNAFLMRSRSSATNRSLALGLFSAWGSHVDIGQKLAVRFLAFVSLRFLSVSSAHAGHFQRGLEVMCLDFSEQAAYEIDDHADDKDER